MEFIRKNYEVILKGMAEIAGTAPLATPKPRLIAVSKTQNWERVSALLTCGHRVFGENRYQEAKERWEGIRHEAKGMKEDQPHAPCPTPHALELHYIGSLQSNKAAEVVAFFDCIHSLDRPKLADALAKAMRDQGKNLPLYIQVNTGEEPQKAGVMPQEAAGFIRYCRDELQLNIVGLMCIPPAGLNPAPHFAFLRNLAATHHLPRLSMGMSDDWREALRMGATDIRVGSGLFGSR